MDGTNPGTYTAQSIIQEMGWDWENLEHPARMVAEYCAKKLNGEMSEAPEDHSHNKHYDSTVPNFDTEGNGSIYESGSFMATRAGANGKVFGEQVSLSRCCQAEIVANNTCSHCGQECEEIQHESAKLSESLEKIKNRFKYLD